MNGKNYSQFLQKNTSQYSNGHLFSPEGIVSNL